MRYLVCIFLLTSCQAATDNNYTLNDAPWSGDDYTICEASQDSNLRPVLFPANINQTTGSINGAPTVKYGYVPKTTAPDGTVTRGEITEKIVNGNSIKIPVYHLKEQYIGFLNQNNIWVSDNGVPVYAKSQFLKMQGESTPPIQSAKEGEPVALSDIEFKQFHERVNQAIQKAPPCTYHYTSILGRVDINVHLDYDSNNPFVCDQNGGFKRSTELNTVLITTRPIVTHLHARGHYFKMPDGSVKYIREHHDPRPILTDKNGDDICDWKPLHNPPRALK